MALSEYGELQATSSSVVAVAWAASSAGAAPLTVTAPVDISIPSPFAPGCGDAAEGSNPGTNFNYPDSEVEPWLAVSPTNPNDVAGFWQQDRWSDGGSHGLVAAVSHNGGASFAYSWPAFSNCAGGTGDNGGYGRSSDPWVSWAPNGDLWSISLSVDQTTARNAILVSRMRHGESAWSEPTTLKFDNSRTGLPQGNNFNDKESLTADPTDAERQPRLRGVRPLRFAEPERAAAGIRKRSLVPRAGVVLAHDQWGG
jgi:hypothetical protein